MNHTNVLSNNVTQIIGSAGTQSFTYDSVDRLTSATHTGQANESYTYDAVGNRTASHLSASYTYQPFNRLASTSAATLSYDNNGNLTSKTEGLQTTQYVWDFENRLTQVSRLGSQDVWDKYDALGRRIERNKGIASPIPLATETTRFVYDGPDVVRDLDGAGSAVADYLNAPGIDNKLRQTVSGTALYFIQDHLGTTRGFADASGNGTSSLTYDAFGNVANGSPSTRYTYTGREMDSDTGLIYYRARFYDAQLGRFISEDPIGMIGGLNFYSYVGNNPSKFTDPTGTQIRSDRNFWPNEIDPATGRRYGDWSPATRGCSEGGWGPFGALGDFWGNYEDMRTVNTIGADKFFHCMANCEAARRGTSGSLVASFISELRELVDEHIKGDPRSACDDDRYANDVGRAGGSGCRPCSAVCLQFRPNGLVFPVPTPAPPAIDWNKHSWGGGGRGW